MENFPPPLQKTENGDLNVQSLADVIEWFLNYDERVAAVRHPDVDAIYQWRQQDAKINNQEMAPFDRAEDRLAIGIFQALAENNTEQSLHVLIKDLLAALQEAKQLNAQVSEDYKLAENVGLTPLEAANLLPTNDERRLYLAACWLEILCTAEIRVLGWVYEQLYEKSFAP
jgi:hypothetical protein